MKKILLIGAVAASLSLSASEPGLVHFGAESWKVPGKDVKVVRPQAAKVKPPVKKTVSKAEAADAKEYNAALQTFYDFNYNFTTTNGLVESVYPIKVTRNGNQVTISNMLNYDDEMNAYYGYRSVDVTGTYDEQAKTITIPTPHADGYNVTLVGEDDYSGYALMGGRQDEDYEFYPEDELVFHVVGDFERIYTNQHIGVVSVYDGETGYLAGSYASLYAVPTDSPRPLVVLPAEMDLGKTYPENTMTGDIQLVNMGKESLNFALSVPAGTEGLTFEPALGEAYPSESFVVNLKYAADAPGEFSIPVTLAYETAADEVSETVTVKGQVEAFPDYSEIVKAGEISFATGYNYPFVMTGEEGSRTAVSSVNQSYQKSWLEARVTVPENHSGKFAYKGTAKCADPDDAWATHSASIYLDGSDEAFYSTCEDVELDNVIELEPGEHKVRFEFGLGAIYYGSVVDFNLSLSELSFTTEMAAAEGVEVLTPEIDFGGLLLEDASASKTMAVDLRNLGSTPLKVTGFRSSDPAFTATLPAEEATLMSTISVPVTLTATEARTYEGTFTIETSAGAVEAKATALVREMPDFSKILDDEAGLVKVTTDMDHPFMMSADGTKAYNANAGEEDTAEVTSTIVFKVTVPENKIAYVSWKAASSTDAGDQTCIKVDGPSGFDYEFISGVTDASSDVRYAGKERYLEMVPGVHTVEITYTKNGDGVIGGDDMFSISKFTTKVEDFDTKAAEPDRSKIRFADCILPSGGVNTNRQFRTLYLMNLGSEELRVLEPDEIEEELPDSYPFSYQNPIYVVHHGQPLMIPLAFFPQEEGKFENIITIPTTFGNYTIEGEGYAYTADGMLLTEDMSDGAARWTLIDNDGDGENWFNVASRFSWRPDLESFSGDDALMSYSARSGQEYTPDNYAVSPEFEVPADGGMLSWWVSPYDENAAAESYELSVVPAAEYDKSKLGTYPVAFSETLEPAHKWFKQNTLDLAPYAGKSVRLVYRHNTANAQSGIRLDDVFAYSNDKWNAVTSAVKGIVSDAEVVRTEYYDLTGVRVSEQATGIVIKRSYLKDGSVKVEKTIK